MAYRKHDALAKPGTVAYLVANAERLTKNGAFTGQQAARTVFLHLCCHPAAVWTPDKPSTWGVRVDNDSCDPGDIAEATGLTRRSVDRALDWLAAGGFIDLTRKGAGPRKRYGTVIISATNPSSDWKRRYGHDVLKHPLSPGYGRDVLNKDMVSLSDGPQAVEEPPKPKRTVSGVRSSCGNTGGSEPPATLKTAPLGGAAPRSPRSPGGPEARPTLDVPEARSTWEAGHSDTPSSRDIEQADPKAPKASSRRESSCSPDSPGPAGMRTAPRGAPASGHAKPGKLAPVRAVDAQPVEQVDEQVARDFLEARRAGLGMDAARFRLYYDTGSHSHQPARQHAGASA